MNDKARERLNKIEMKRKQKEESQKGSFNANDLYFLICLSHTVMLNNL